MQRYFEVNDEGYNIRCKLYYKDIHDIEKIIIFGHGFGGHKDNKAAENFAEFVLSKYKKIAIVTFNWPCHGDDVRKKLKLDECHDYLAHVLKYLEETYKTNAFYAYGTSFGGYMFLSYIHKNGNPFKKIVLRCPAINIYEVMTNSIMKAGDYDKLLKGKEALVGFDRKIKMGLPFLDELKENDIRKYEFIDYAEDILIIHGTKDEVVPFADSATFADDNIIELVSIEGADHRFLNKNHMTEATKRIIEFFEL